MPTALQRRLSRSPEGVVALYAAGAAFSVYVCMYAFRKAFGAAGFAGDSLWGLEYKSVLIMAQAIGYTLSKFLGIKVIAEMKAGRRALFIVGLILAAELALLGYALTPRPWNWPFMLLNGIPLGFIWGLVFSFLEGRRTTEALGAALSVSFIVASGFVKRVGKWLLVDWSVSEDWMPVLTGALFVLPLLLFTWLLNQVPPPSAADVAQRSPRLPMTASQRWALLRQVWPGMLLLVLVYVLLTAFRDFRDNYANELWAAMGYADSPSVFTESETLVSLGVLGAMGLLMLIRSNRRALDANIALIFGGFVLVGVANLLFEGGEVGPLGWMILNGLGLFLAYVPFNAILFDRLLATFRFAGNVGFLIYVADAFGYLGSIGVLLYKNLASPNLSWLRFFLQTGYGVSLVGSVLTLGALLYFRRRYSGSASPASTP